MILSLLFSHSFSHRHILYGKVVKEIILLVREIWLRNSEGKKKKERYFTKSDSNWVTHQLFKIKTFLKIKTIDWSKLWKLQGFVFWVFFVLLLALDESQHIKPPARLACFFPKDILIYKRILFIHGWKYQTHAIGIFQYFASVKEFWPDIKNLAFNTANNLPAMLGQKSRFIGIVKSKLVSFISLSHGMMHLKSICAEFLNQTPWNVSWILLLKPFSIDSQL